MIIIFKPSLVHKILIISDETFKTPDSKSLEGNLTFTCTYDVSTSKSKWISDDVNGTQIYDMLVCSLSCGDPPEENPPKLTREWDNNTWQYSELSYKCGESKC